jgi:hypothetical protein
VVQNLPEAARPAVTFAYITGWRIDSEVLKLVSRRIDFDAGEVQLYSTPRRTAKDGPFR